MNFKQISFILFIIVILIGGYFLLFPLKGANHTVNLDKHAAKVIDSENQDVDVQIRDMSDVPTEYYSGNSRYSYGECQGDGDCEQTGCSLESCSSDSDRLTTCEIDGNAPDKNIYSCGCIKDVCGWYRK